VFVLYVCLFRSLHEAAPQAALVLGAGGTARAACYALMRLAQARCP
jgi:shikimate 5-dehydrogenase